MEKVISNTPAVIIGAGPAGLAAAHELVRQHIRPVVLERANNAGGIARTEVYKDYYFDIGGHRFFTKIDEIDRLWHEMLGKEFLKVPRRSRIYYRDRFFNYPLSFYNALSNLGLIESVLIMLSYLNSQIRPYPREDNFEEWVSNRFGRRLYKTFFKTYTEKVWGIPCHKIQADWAAQRIKGLSLMVALTNALFGTQKAKSLIDEFLYPLKGPGLMWQSFVRAIEAGGGEVCFNSEAIQLKHENGYITSVKYTESKGESEMPVRHLISSMPISKLVTLLDPKAPNEVLEAARNLSYRSFLMVGLIVDKEDLFPDQWVYIHSPNVKVGRIQNFKNWSAAMVPDPQTTSVGMEYFCDEGDEIWNLSDSALTDLAMQELSELGLAVRDDLKDSFVVRQPKAYPVYDDKYGVRLRMIRDYLGLFGNLQTIGRNGMHRYNNMDHSMQTGKLAAQNILGADHNLWEVNEKAEYHEEDKSGKVRALFPQKILERTFARLDKVALATATGSVSGFLALLATLWLVVKGGDVVGPNLRLLGQYFIGYTVTVKGAFIAFSYAFLWGFLYGWLFAYLRNFFIAYYIYRVKKKTAMLSFTDFLDQY